VILTRLGVPWLWGADVEKGWVFMRFNVVPIVTRLLAPGSCSYGLERLPETGGAVLAVNHLSAIDPPLIGSFSNRAIFYMAKYEILQIPIVGEALTWTGGFPVRRGEPDRNGLRAISYARGTWSVFSSRAHVNASAIRVRCTPARP
jgi:1-acyl-sn-glycerol-3-phosphate acyltransferase